MKVKLLAVLLISFLLASFQSSTALAISDWTSPANLGSGPASGITSASYTYPATQNSASYTVTVAAWINGDDNNVSVTSTTDGINWSTPVSAGAQQSQWLDMNDYSLALNPRITVSNGKWAIAWVALFQNNYRELLTVQSNTGTDWESSYIMAPFHGQNLTGDYDFELFSSNGELLYGWQTASGYWTSILSSVSPNQFFFQRLINAGAGSKPYIFTNSTGLFGAVWKDASSNPATLNYSQIEPAVFPHWATPTIVPNSQISSNPQGIFTSINNPLVVWNTTNGSVSFTSYDPGSSQWVTGTLGAQISLPTVSTTYPQIAVTYANGNDEIVVTTTTNLGQSLNTYHTSNFGGNWDLTSYTPQNSETPTHPQLITGIDDNLLLLWSETENGVTELWGNISNDFGQSWIADTQFSNRDAEGISFSNAFAVNSPDGSWLVSWLKNQNAPTSPGQATLMSARTTDATNWSFVENSGTALFSYFYFGIESYQLASTGNAFNLMWFENNGPTFSSFVPFYNLSFNAQGATNPQTVSFPANSLVSLPPALTRNGYTFNGWFSNSTGGAPLASSFSTLGITSDTTLFAQWSANSHIVTYNTQGGSAVSNGAFYTGANVTLPAAPTKSGYIFDGWFTAATGGTALTSPYSPGVITDITVYAQWSVDTNGSSTSGLSHTGSNVQSLLNYSGALIAVGVLLLVVAAIRRRRS